MRKLVRIWAPFAVLAVTLFSSASHATPSKTRIATATARNYAKKAAAIDQGRARWSVTLGKSIGSRSEFVARDRSGKVAPVFGTIEMKKGGGAPEGLARVRIRHALPM
jgi:hypothetical protein